MPIEQVKLEIKKLKCPVPDTLSVKRGKIGLYRGDFARVEIWTSKTKPLCLVRKIGNEVKRQFFGLDEITRANDTARAYEWQGKQNGAAFGTLSHDEETALRVWRNFVFAEIKAGKPRPLLSEIIENLIDRERTKDETPLFATVARDFIDAKEKAGAGAFEYQTRRARRVEKLSRTLAGKRLAEITEPILLEAIEKAIVGRKGAPPASKTWKHWIETAKEVFKWWFTRENATRRASEKLNNPLEIVEPPKTAVESEPEVLSVRQAREILSVLWEVAPESVPVVVLQMFCGVRMFEALRLRWSDIIDGELRLSRKITKTQQARAVPVPANALAWLDACRARGIFRGNFIFPINELNPAKLKGATPDEQRRIEAESERSRANAYSWRIEKTLARLDFAKPKNAFRHTAVSCLAVIHGQSRAADWCGHSRQIQGQHYRNPVSQIQAQDYFGIMPPQGDGKAIAFDRSRAKTTAGSASEPQGDGELAQDVPAAETGKASA